MRAESREGLSFRQDGAATWAARLLAAANRGVPGAAAKRIAAGGKTQPER